VAVYTSSKDAAKVLKVILAGEVLEHVASLARSWSGLAGSDAPKYVTLLALAQLLGVVERRWAVELWLAHKASTTSLKPEAAKALEDFLAKVEGVDKVKWAERGVNLYFKLRNVEAVSQAATLRLYTDFRDFRLYCHLCSETSASKVLRAVTEELRFAVEQLKQEWISKEGQEWPKWYWNAISLPAGVGWPVFLRLWVRHNATIRVAEGSRELLRVEVLEARPDGTARFRLWYYKWLETRPRQPYVDFEVKPYWRKGGKIGFKGHVYANKAVGILREHLAEIVELLEEKGVKGVACYYREQKETRLDFSGAFRDSVLATLGIAPELPRAEPLAVEHLGGFRFKVGNKEVEFGRRYVKGGYEFYAVLRLSSAEEAVRFAASLRAVGVDAKVVSNAVKLDSDSFFGLLVATGVVPPGLTLLYRSDEDDFRVYACVEEGRMRFFFAVRQEGV